MIWSNWCATISSLLGSISPIAIRCCSSSSSALIGTYIQALSCSFSISWSFCCGVFGTSASISSSLIQFACMSLRRVVRLLASLIVGSWRIRGAVWIYAAASFLRLSSVCALVSIESVRFPSNTKSSLFRTIAI